MAIKSSDTNKKLEKILSKLSFVCFAMLLLCILILVIVLLFFPNGDAVETFCFVLAGFTALVAAVGFVAVIWLVAVHKRMAQDCFLSAPSRTCANIESGTTICKNVFREKKELICKQKDLQSRCEACDLPSPTEFSNSIFEKYYKPFYDTVDGMAALATYVALWGTIYQINHPLDATIKNEYKAKQFTSLRDEAILTKYPWLVSLKIFR